MQGALLSEEEKKILLSIARNTLESYIRHKKISEFNISSDVLKEKRGAFVSLHKKGTLRGCIGYIEAIKPLDQTIIEMTIAAGTQDPRFPPVTSNELTNIDIEISVLTPLKKIKDVGEIEVGKHGILIRKGFYSGLLLPQVATEYGWDRYEFLEHTCSKAGLPNDAWKHGAVILIFEAQVFGEKERD
jgi:AmmeMemoRadiSam system protein A